MKLTESKTADRGTPTALRSECWGVKRRFEFLLKYSSLRGKSILDLGCGFGAYSKFAMSSGADLVVGLDINQRFLKNGKSAEMVEASGDSIPFKDSCFDVVLMIEVLEHLPDEKKALLEVRRILKNGGLLFITVPNKLYPFETHGMQICNTNLENLFGIGIPFLSWLPLKIRENVARARIYTQRRLLKLLTEKNFELIAIDYMMPPMDGQVKNQALVNAFRKISRIIEGTIFRFFGCHLLVLSHSIE